MMWAHEPSTHTINSTNVIVDIMLSLDNQWIEEVLGSMGTTGHPYWTAVDSVDGDGICVWWQIRHEILQRLFRDDMPLQHQAITGSLDSEENVDDST